MQENKRPVLLSAFGEGGGARCICGVFGLQVIFESQCTSMVTHLMSTVRADNFCPVIL